MRYLSVFSGVEAATLAWEPLGWKAVAFCEIDAFPSAVLKERWPNVPNLGDITKVDWSEYRGAVDVVVGGSPCQSFSIAGNRTGLDGASGLMWEYVRCVQEVRPRWFVWENVPGALSSAKGEDFRCLLESMDELGYGLAWRVLDAQFFGVAQRRRRLFLVGSLGDGGAERAAEVLFERESLRWDTTSSREKRKELAAGAEESTGERRSAGFSAGQSAKAGTLGYQEEIAPTLRAGESGTNQVPTIITPKVWQIAGNIINRQPQHGGHQIGVRDPEIDGAFTLTTADRHAVAIAANQRGELRYDGGDGDTVGALPASRSGKQIQAVMTPKTMLVRCGKPGGGKGALVQDDVSATLSTGNEQTLFAPVCMTDTQSDSMVGDVCGTLTHRMHKYAHVVCIADDNANAAVDVDMSGTLKVGGSRPAVANGFAVRKLTPRECERLQGMPDDHTRIPWKGRPAEECPDTPRYKAIGNSFAVPVVRWIGERIEKADANDLNALHGFGKRGVGTC